MNKILSVKNALVQKICALQSVKERRAQGLFVAEGERVIQTLLQNQVIINWLVCTDATLALAQHLVSDQQLILVSEQIMHKISASVTPPGLLGVFQIPHHSASLSSGLVLAQVADPGNMGTLIRTCAAMGYQTVVVVAGCDPWSSKVVQASAGTIGAVNLFEMSWSELVKHKGDLQLCALVVKGGQDPADLNLDNSLLVVGNEAHGLPDEWILDCEQKLTLPMPGKTESLNVAIAGSIVLFLIK